MVYGKVVMPPVRYGRNGQVVMTRGD